MTIESLGLFVFVVVDERLFVRRTKTETTLSIIRAAVKAKIRSRLLSFSFEASFVSWSVLNVI